MDLSWTTRSRLRIRIVISEFRDLFRLQSVTKHNRFDKRLKQIFISLPTPGKGVVLGIGESRASPDSERDCERKRVFCPIVAVPAGMRQLQTADPGEIRAVIRIGPVPLLVTWLLLQFAMLLPVQGQPLAKEEIAFLKNPQRAVDELMVPMRTRIQINFQSHLKPAPGSANRILIYEKGVANWEGEDIDPNEAIPD